MKSIAYQLHEAFNGLTRFHFPFEEKESIIPQNGIYCLFEKGEHFDPFDRIVRIGSHTGKDRLLFRLKEHFLNTGRPFLIWIHLLFQLCSYFSSVLLVNGE